MWKRTLVFFIYMTICTVQAANLSCTFFGTYQCTNYVLSPVTQVDEPFTVIGAPFTPFKDNITTTFSLTGMNIIQEFPRNLFGIFVNLGSFFLQYITTSSLIADSFYNCDKLDTITIKNSSLGYIRNRFASTCHSLKWLTITNTPIQGIEEFAFEGLYNLTMLDLTGCKLTCIPPSLFQPLTSVGTILLTRNELTAIHSQLFAGLGNLQLINMAYNLIQYIPNINFNTTGAPKIELSFNCYECPIRAIDPSFMAALYYGRGIYSAKNGEALIFLYQPSNSTACMVAGQSFFSGDIYVIGKLTNNFVAHDQVLRNYTTCYSDFTAEMRSDVLASATCPFPLTTTAPSTTVSTTVTTSQSSTSTSPPAISGQCATDKVCRYYLDWNDHYTCVIDGAEGTVTSISGSHYLTYTDLDLTRLYFKNSFLSLVPKIIFEKFPNLKYLHVADCGLNIIDDKTFNECGNLEFLDASNNQVSRFVETSLKNCTKLKLIDLTGNPIDHISNDLYQFDPALERIHLRRLDDWVLA